MRVVTRYAPSPTGPLHIGGARTALFNWAFARRHGGRFLLRFEDTDRARSTREHEQEVLEAFDWLGIDYDPVSEASPIPRQSERTSIYREAIDELLAEGRAYRCVCTTEELEEMRARARGQGSKLGYDGRCRERGIGPDPGKSFCVRLRVLEAGVTRWKDLIAGPSGEAVEQIEDFVIARSDGTPIYHLAVVVDDHEMGVTHVVRGREHMTSTPRQLLLYEALKLRPPEFAHVPLLVEPGGKKLSKRQASVSVQDYRGRGLLPDAVLNFITRLGWSHGDLEIFSKEDLARLFSLEGIGHSASQVHDDKLLWLNQHYIKTLPGERLIQHLGPFLDEVARSKVSVDAGLVQLTDLLRERSKTLIEMAELARFYLIDDVEPQPKAARKYLKAEVFGPLRDLHGELSGLATWNQESLKPGFERVLERHGLKLGELAQPVRVAITGTTVSPGIFETLEVLGRDRSLARISRVLERPAAGESDQSAAGRQP
jgi:glutamyl-tRNA synthetase